MLWKWKLARSLDDVLHLLNGETRYDRPVPNARVCMSWRGDHPQFWVFATKAAKAREPQDRQGAWSWKRAADADEALRFLRGDAPGVGRVGQAQIAAVWAGGHYEFFIFFRAPVPGDVEEPVPGDWEWKLATDRDDVLLFLNGRGQYEHPVTTARIATAHRDHHDEYFIFYRRDVGADPCDDWQWQAVADANDVRGAVERKGQPPLEFQVAAPPAGHGVFQVFTNQAGHVLGQEGRQLVRRAST